LTAPSNTINAPRDAAIFLSSASNASAAGNFSFEIFADARIHYETRLFRTPRTRGMHIAQRGIARVG